MLPGWISRGECARRLGVSAMSVTNFCRLYGMPFRISDGRVCWPDVLYWSDLNRCPEDSGSWYSLHRRFDRLEWSEGARRGNSDGRLRRRGSALDGRGSTRQVL